MRITGEGKHTVFKQQPTNREAALLLNVKILENNLQRIAELFNDCRQIYQELSKEKQLLQQQDLARNPALLQSLSKLEQDIAQVLDILQDAKLKKNEQSSKTQLAELKKQLGHS